MARSYAVWLVTDETGLPLGAFTVKHECGTWLRSFTEQQRHRWTVHRMRDGLGPRAVDNLIKVDMRTVL